MTEQRVVGMIESQLNADGRWYVNFHGSMFSKSGTPDILTVDRTGKLVGVEIKKPGGMVAINQLRRGLEIIKSGGRFVIATNDFDLADLDNYSLCLVSADDRDEFELFEQPWSKKVSHSVEVTL